MNVVAITVLTAGITGNVNLNTRCFGLQHANECRFEDFLRESGLWAAQGYLSGILEATGGIRQRNVIHRRGRRAGLDGNVLTPCTRLSRLQIDISAKPFFG